MYSGDEIGTLNDYNYCDNPAHERDSRWVYRPRTDWGRYAKRNDINTIDGRVFSGSKQLIELRKLHEAFAGGELKVIQTENEHVLGLIRTHSGRRAVTFANFSDESQPVSAKVLWQYFIWRI